MKDFNKLSKDEKTLFLNSIVEKRKQFYECLNLNNHEGEKVFLAITFFLQKAKAINFSVSEIHLLKFIALVEFLYTKDTGKIWTKQVILATENGLVPIKLKTLIESNNNIEGTAFKFEKTINEKDEDISISLGNDEDISHYEYILGASERWCIDQAIKLIFELKTPENISNYFYDNSISWKKIYNENIKNHQFNKEMNFLEDIENDEDRDFSKMMYDN